MHTSPVHRQFADKGLVIPMTTRLSTKLSSKKHRRLAHEGASRRRQSSVWHNASHRFRRLLCTRVTSPNEHGLRLPCRTQERVPLASGPRASPEPPLAIVLRSRGAVGDFLLATRSLSFEFESPKSTNSGTAYQAASKEIPTLANVFALGVSRVRGVTLMANDARCRRQAVLLSDEHCSPISGVRD